MRYSITALLLILLVPTVGHAQLTNNIQLGAPIVIDGSFSISATPQYPTPHSQVTLSFLSSSIDLMNATMTISMAGKQIYSGNVRPFAFSVGGMGSVTTATVKIISMNSTYTQKISIQPQDVSLIAEPLASIPPMYKGKPLVPLSGNTRIVAMANFKDGAGKTIDPSKLVYSWNVDGARLANSSGIGKSSVLVASALKYRIRSVSVDIQNQAGGLTGGATMQLSGSEPSVQIYENDPLLGIRFDHALSGSYTLAGTEAILFAAPFSLPLGGAFSLQWFLNGQPAHTGNLLTIRSTGKGKGAAGLSLTASSGMSDNPATKSVSLVFGTPVSTNIFGL